MAGQLLAGHLPYAYGLSESALSELSECGNFREGQR